MNTNMTGFRYFSSLCILVLKTNVASALERLILVAAKESRTILMKNSGKSIIGKMFIGEM